MPSVIMVSNYFCLERQHSSHCRGREINVGAFSGSPWEQELSSCPQSIRNPDIAFLHPGHTWAGIPQRSIFLFAESLLLWAEGKASPKCTARSHHSGTFVCAWALKATHSNPSSLGPQKGGGQNSLGIFLPPHSV